MDYERRKIVISFGLKIGLFLSHRLTQTDTPVKLLRIERGGQTFSPADLSEIDEAPVK